jgi:hypothetical protein
MFVVGQTISLLVILCGAWMALPRTLRLAIVALGQFAGMLFSGTTLFHG